MALNLQAGVQAACFVCPGALKELLHYYTTSVPYVDCAEGRSFAGDLIASGLMELRAPDSYHVTDKGRCYIEALLAVPLPVQVWMIPERGA